MSTNTSIVIKPQSFVSIKLNISVKHVLSTLQDNPGHDHLSEMVCNEVLSAPDSPHVRLWVRILNQMEVSPDNEVLIKDLRILAYKMVKVELVGLFASPPFSEVMSLWSVNLPTLVFKEA